MSAPKILLATLLLPALFFACKSQQPSSSTQATPFVGLQMNGCFGYCPVFSLTVLSNGTVRYEGKRFAEKEGRDSFQLTPPEMARLQAKVAATNLWQYPEVIRSEVADAPSADLFAYKDKRTKRVSGSIDRPAPLLELENLLKELSEAHGFQVTRGVNPHAVPEGSRKEIILKLKPDVNAGNWIAQFSDIRLRLVRRLAEENIWLVAYDSKQIEERNLIDLLKSTEGAVEVKSEK